MFKKCQRRSIRIPGFDYSTSAGYFITVCAYERRCLFGNVVDGQMCINSLGEIISQQWLKTSEIRPDVILDSFVVMPNHFHGIIILTSAPASVGAHVVSAEGKRTSLVAGSLGAIIGQFKSVTTRYINQLNGTRSNPVWQRNYYEHVIRNERDLERIRYYIENNPMQWYFDSKNSNSR